MITINDNLKGKTAVVTGGGGVLCGAMSMELARHGVKVAVLSRKEENAQEVVNEIKKDGGEAFALSCDVLEQASITKAAEAVKQQFPDGLDILINGAGGNHPDASTSEEYFMQEHLEDPDVKTFFDLTEEGLKHVFNLNYVGTVMATQEFMKQMVGRDNGIVINISSMSAPSPMTKVLSYSSAKAGIDNFTQWLAVHMAKENIRCNAIAPGFFLTSQNRALLLKEDGSHTARSGKIISQTPMERFGKPEDLLGTLLWLTDEKMSGFVTGITVPVDGGFMAYSGV
ncbi:NAD(P)-dependent dehydrogenase (short-subunit alcohol dehydrogenase family) [Sinobaca qinghaiensis]|uniref:NAD(P)-dependent dehydrogenase (Short-subunit alcohol dehydrogenase family) n=1 Tax=Sinobaca qinghaiensis TaxID=342944 RepID=A0A419V8S6_9BACL|nr:SDR family oxidoreductase [Sinobaca qinghaiensis]RKD76329.1 NAD(P)-dependent dehydrogenase (short-subunit alcohol dehydrogenase family) [Sinobaca qinghaiensis]